MTSCDRDRRAVATTPPSPLARLAATKLMRPTTYRRPSIKFCGSNSSLEYLVGDTLPLATLSRFYPFPSFVFLFFSFSFLFFHRWYRCLLLGRVTNYSPRRRSKNLISNSPYLWSRRLNISLQTPLSVPLLHAVFSPPPIVFFPFSARNTMARATSGQKGGPVPCKVIRSDIRKFNRNYATKRIQSECRLAKNQ